MNIMPYLEDRETKYNLRPNPLSVPRVAHAFAESCLTNFGDLCDCNSLHLYVSSGSTTHYD